MKEEKSNKKDNIEIKKVNKQVPTTEKNRKTKENIKTAPQTEKEKKQAKKLEKKKRKQEKKQRRKKSTAWKIFKLLLLLFVIAIVLFAGFFTYRVIKNGGGLQGFMAAAVGHDENTLKDLDKIYFLIIGISGCEEDYKLADTIMLCSYDPKTQKASILSIPRDTYVGKNKAKASASYKINAMYRNGENIPGMIKSIEEITGIDIANYIIVDTDALVELVDTIGGVEFDVPIDMKYDDVTQDLHIDLKAGYQKLNGEQAEWLVRFRHNNDGTSYPLSYGDNDIGRMRTQREFIKATLEQTLKPENIFNINKIAQIAFKNITTNVNFDTIKDYIPYAVNFKIDNLKTGTLPGVPELANGVWIYTVNKKQTEEMIQDLFADELEENEDGENLNTISSNTTKEKTETKQEENIKDKEETIKIELLNGTGSNKTLAEVEKKLKEKGYNVTKTGNTSKTSKTSIINRTNKNTKTTNEIKEALGIGVTSKKSNNSKVDYTIIIGTDYK